MGVEVTSMGLCGAVLGPLHLCCGCWFGVWVVSWQWKWVCLWIFCLLLGFFSSDWITLFSLHRIVFAFSYCILFIMFGCCFLEACSFLKGNRESESGGVEGGEIVVSVYCMREEYIFNKKKRRGKSKKGKKNPTRVLLHNSQGSFWIILGFPKQSKNCFSCEFADVTLLLPNCIKNIKQSTVNVTSPLLRPSLLP